jgi:hypothetical protein
MTRNWKALGLAALLVAAVGTAHGRPDPEKTTSVPKQLEDIEAMLRALNKNFDTLRGELRDVSVRGAQAARDVGDLKERLGLLEQQLRTQREMLRAMQAVTQDRRDLQDRRLDALERQSQAPDAVARRAFSFTPEAPRRAGTLRLQNRSAYGATVTVNGDPHFVPAFETREIRNMAAGTFTYAVAADGFGVIRPTVTRALNPGEIFTLYINPGQPAPLLLGPAETVIYVNP